jgi:hypothetical protein
VEAFNATVDQEKFQQLSLKFNLTALRVLTFTTLAMLMDSIFQFYFDQLRDLNTDQMTNMTAKESTAPKIST